MRSSSSSKPSLVDPAALPRFAPAGSPLRRRLFADTSPFFALEIALRAAASLPARTAVRSGPTDLFLMIADHFEPRHGRVCDAAARARVEEWLARYPAIAERHRDAGGRPPAHTFFYPWDECDPWELERLAALSRAGYGEVELHLHHGGDTSASLRRKLEEAVRAYRLAGALSRWPDGRAAYGFVHGDWALDNSRPGEKECCCGVDDEIDLLLATGCYADFTFPAWRHASQPRAVNRLLLAVDDPRRPKSYDRAPSPRAGEKPAGLLLVQGPLVPHLRRTPRGPRLAMEDPDLSASRRYAPERLDRWVRAHIHVPGRPDRVFVKLHCHGAPERHREALLGGDLAALFRDAEARYNDGRRWRLHYVTAREMFNVIRATIAGAPCGPEEARDWLLPRPA